MEVKTSSVGKELQEQKLDEMAWMIRNLSNEMAKIESKNINQPRHNPNEKNRNKNQFRRPIYPQILQNGKRNVGDQVQPLVTIDYEEDPEEGYEFSS